MVGVSILIACLAGVITAGIALLVCWLATGSRWFRSGILALMAIVWALSGPIVGIGLKQMIAHVLDFTGWLLPGSRAGYGLAVALYYGPSPLPAIWADCIRFFPCAIAVLWPVVRLFPQELRDAVRVDGASPWQEFRHLVLPLSLPTALRAGLAVAILSLGELGAGKLVDTPGSQTFAHEVFAQMHYGVTNDLAALSLVLLAAVVLGGSLFGLWQGSRRVA
jgi:ABC-type Fe3+ transport system permease subunit